MNNIIKKEDKGLSTQSIQALHEYIRVGLSSISIAARVVSSLHSKKGIGSAIVQGTDQTLYFYGDHYTHYVFSVGGRFIVFIVKTVLNLTKARRNTINKRFLRLDDVEDEHLITHFGNLINTTSHRHSTLIKAVNQGTFTLHMWDLCTPYVEIGSAKEGPLVIPLDLITESSKLSIIPRNIIQYMGQHLLLLANDDYTVRLLYSSHLLDKSLFTQR